MSAARVGLIAWAALVALFVLWHFWWAPPATGSAWIAAGLLVLPLLLPVLALRRGDTRRARLWVGILTLFYFAHGVVAAYSEPRARGPALVEVLLCLVFIASLGYEARHYRRRRG